MFITIISILVIASAVWVIRKTFKLNLCPVCVGVSLTWLWLLIGQWSGELSTADYQLPTAILMGGTVVGLMSKLEPFIESKFILVWKTVFVVSGFLAVYSLLVGGWLIFVIGMILASAATLASKTGADKEEKEKSDQAKKLEEKMKSCC